MLTELSYDLGRLVLEALHKAICLGVLTASHSEVLPHHNTVSVAEVKELLGMTPPPSSPEPECNSETPTNDAVQIANVDNPTADIELKIGTQDDANA